MTDQGPYSTVDAVRRFFGAALIAVGGLMMVLCGGCGALVFVLYFVDAFAHPNDAGMMLIPVVVGGAPALVGFGLFAVGRALRRDPPSAA